MAKNISFECTSTKEEVHVDYFSYLCNRVDLNDHMGKTYFRLARIMHDKHFVAIVDMDINRIKDALAMREEWIVDNNYARKMASSERSSDGDILVPEFVECYTINSSYVSFLEVLIAFAARIEKDIMIDDAEGDRTSIWFWHMMQNSGLDHFDDSCSGNWSIASRIIDSICNRDYGSDGSGGLFPVMRSKADQREVELWYQFMGWLNENDVW